jgi:hypothetical protein
MLRHPQFEPRCGGLTPEGVTPSLPLDSKHARIKQDHQEGRARRTETTSHDTRDFGSGQRLCSLPVLRRLGFQANRRLLDVQRISQDGGVGEDAFGRVPEPSELNDQRVSGLRFAAVAVPALLSALLVFRLLPRGFSARAWRDHGSPLVGKSPAEITSGQMTFHLGRLRLHGWIERIAGTHRDRVTREGGRTAVLHPELEPAPAPRTRADHCRGSPGRFRLAPRF